MSLMTEDRRMFLLNLPIAPNGDIDAREARGLIGPINTFAKLKMYYVVEMSVLDRPWFGEKYKWEINDE